MKKKLFSRKELTMNFLELQRINTQQTLHQGVILSVFIEGLFNFNC